MAGEDSIHSPVARADTRLTYGDLLLFPDDGKRHEIIDGEHDVTPSPNRRHQERCGYFVPGAASESATVATVLSHRTSNVALVSLTFTNPSVSCSVDTSFCRTVIGARSTSNFGS